ncbi:MAG: hypothetical protein JSW42_04530 [Chloroflexota bacterium]|nr:MAG: hypothetical protein JSW42_04530 [Chloroflexota bacterium]
MLPISQRRVVSKSLTYSAAYSKSVVIIYNGTDKRVKAILKSRHIKLY